MSTASSWISVRSLRPGEAHTYLAIHRASVRGLAAGHYEPAVIEAWAPEPITNAQVRAVEEDSSELRWIAEIDGQPCGMAALVPDASELRACYVVPSFAGRGVGRALVEAVEHAARAAGLTELHLVASVNAEHFYRAMGFEVARHTEHTLPGGHRMAAVEMQKPLRQE